MKLSLLGRKVGMTQVFDESGNAIGVTVIEAGPCPVVQVKDAKKDGYSAIQIAYGKAKQKHTTKALQGHYAKAKVELAKRLREVRLDGPAEHEVGTVLTVDVFEVGTYVDISGVTKGRGFQGVVKRHGFTGGKATHGCTTHKLPGSIGASAYPSRVIKNKKLPGHMGDINFTSRNLKVVGIDKERNLIWVRGSVPGHTNSYVVVRQKA
ncbi:MAG: 50S ribosomal protein L3 [Candidatus Eisenbacteria bacterium]|nr:50S ribosomal protein L3 [Candidatus Eisenbacteria bacterium]